MKSTVLGRPTVTRSPCLTPAASRPRAMRLVRRSSSRQVGERVERHFPQEAVRIGEIAAVAAPENLSWRLHRGRARGHGEGEHRVHGRLRGHVVGEREAGEPGSAAFDLGVVSQSVAAIEAEPGALQAEHHVVVAIGVVVGLEAETLAVEGHRRRQVAHAQGDHADARFAPDQAAPTASASNSLTRCPGEIS